MITYFWWKIAAAHWPFRDCAPIQRVISSQLNLWRHKQYHDLHLFILPVIPDAESHILFFDIEGLIFELHSEEYAAMSPTTLEVIYLCITSNIRCEIINLPLLSYVPSVVIIFAWNSGTRIRHINWGHFAGEWRYEKNIRYAIKISLLSRVCTGKIIFFHLNDHTKIISIFNTNLCK